jgi:putative aldouronate transport system permease protein
MNQIYGGYMFSIKKTNKLRWKSSLELLILTLPAFLLVFILNYLPLPGIILAFKNFSFAKGIFQSPWVGFENFRFLFITDAAFRITRNTVLYSLVFLIAGNFTSIVIALMLFELTNRYTVKTFQSLLIFPRFISWVVAAYMFHTLFSVDYGLFNSLLVRLGGEPISWYSTPKAWPFIFLFATLWKGAGFGSVLYFATLMGIDGAYFDSATIDGASKLQTIRHITLPFLYPLITILLILGIGNLMKADFGMFYNLPRDMPTLYNVSDVIETYVFRALRTIGDPAMAAAADLYKNVVGFFLVFGANMVVKKIEPDNSLF